jgi:spore germination cell wall hydrolase CwlJ-like protein
MLGNPSQIAHQDLASLLVQQPGVAERARTFLMARPFSSLRSATYSLSIPVGAGIPHMPTYVHANVTGSIAALSPEGEESYEDGPATPVINRSSKGDMLALRTLPDEPVAAAEAAPAETLAADRGRDIAPAPVVTPADEPASPRADIAGTLARSAEPEPSNSGVMYRLARLFFGDDRAGLPPSIFEHRDAPSGSVAAKGVVTGEEGRPQSPAERLKLTALTRPKHEKCLADAIYYESRGEVEKGQIAVAQVVVNRAFSGFYPDNICGVVYQNAHRHLACQFTFACEGKKLIVDEPDMWEQAKRISREMLDGKLWLSEIGKATHYHAYWVRPDWVREMRRIHRIGVHTFYRPRAWEDG